MNDVNDVWNLVIKRQMAGLVIRGTEGRVDGDILSKLDEIKKSHTETGVDITPGLIRDFAKQHGISNEDRRRILGDSEHFLETGEIRRPEIWPLGY